MHAGVLIQVSLLRMASQFFADGKILKRKFAGIVEADGRTYVTMSDFTCQLFWLPRYRLRVDIFRGTMTVR